MTFKEQVDTIISAKHLLKHPFYQAWTNGQLTLNDLREYAEQYFHHVLAEPTYLSAVHYNTPHQHLENNSGDISARQHILQNLIDEEFGENHHPALWKRFAKALGASDISLTNAKALPETQALVDTFRSICIKQPFYAGLAALYAFESQVPAIAEAKIDGLQKFYPMEARDYDFFTVHQEADQHHSATEWQLIERFADTPEKQAEVLQAVEQASDALWNFLSGVYQKTEVAQCGTMVCH